MKHLSLALLLTLTLASCGKKESSTTIIQEVVAPTPVIEVTPEDQDILNLLQDENDYRLALGQTQLSLGLSCSLQTFTSGDRIQASIAGHNTLAGLSSVGSFLQVSGFNQVQSSVDGGMSALPTSMKNTYKTNYLMRCSGFLVVTDSDYYQFDLTSDDASVLYVAGAKVIDNDNGHGTTKLTGTKFLRRGVHAIRLDYAQLGGEQSLILDMNGINLKGIRFAH